MSAGERTENQGETAEELRRLRARLAPYLDRECASLDDAAQNVIANLSQSQEQARVQSEELTRLWGELEESYRKFQELFDYAPVGYLVVDKAGLILDANVTAARMLGAAKRSLTGKPLRLFVTRGARAQFDEYQRVTMEGKTMELELPVTGRDGEFIALLGAALIRDGGGRVTALRMTIADVTSRRRVEHERAILAAAIGQAAESVIITDREGVIQYVNPEFTRVTGYAAEECVGMTPRILKSGAHGPEFYEAMWAALKRGEVWKGVIINRRKDGGLFEEDATISPVYSAGGALVNFVAIKKDVSREARLAKAREYFASIASHELNTPLGKLELIRMSLRGLRVPPEHAGALERAMRLTGECHDDYERIASATAALTRLSDFGNRAPLRPVNLTVILRSAADHVTSTMAMDQRAVALRLEIEPAARGLTLPADHELLFRAFQETLVNAVKFTPDGKSVTVRAAWGRGVARVTIIDEGVGVSPEKIETLTEPFYSLEDPRHHSGGRYRFRAGGLGLGLSIARLVVDYHGGTLSICSEGENMGTSVEIALPAPDWEPAR